MKIEFKRYSFKLANGTYSRSLRGVMVQIGSSFFCVSLGAVFFMKIGMTPRLSIRRQFVWA